MWRVLVKWLLSFQRVVYLIFDGCTLLSQLPEICSFLRIPMESAREVFLSAEACPSGELLHKLLTRHRAHLPQGALIMMRDERHRTEWNYMWAENMETYFVRGLQNQVASSKNFFMCSFFVLIKLQDHMSLIKYPHLAEKIKFLLPAFHQRSNSVKVQTFLAKELYPVDDQLKENLTEGCLLY